jgi:hypothetical protein
MECFVSQIKIVALVNVVITCSYALTQDVGTNVRAIKIALRGNSVVLKTINSMCAMTVAMVNIVWLTWTVPQRNAVKTVGFVFLKYLFPTKIHFEKNSNVTSFLKSNQIKSNQIKSNQIKSNQIKSNQTKSNVN